MLRIVYLNLDKVDLLGWECEKSDLVVSAICNGIWMGDNFPPVPVVEFNGEYYLDSCRLNSWGVDGGHYRAVGHYIMGSNLKSKLIDLDELNSPPTSWAPLILIQDIIIVEDRGEYKRRKEVFPDYRSPGF